MLEVVLIAMAGAAIAKATELSFDQFRTRRAARKSIALATASDVEGWGWDNRDLLKRLIELDYKILDNTLTEEREGTVDQWAPVFGASPDTWVLLSAGPRRVVGYSAFVALEPLPFQQAKDGILLDSNITVDSISLLDTPGVYNL